LFSGIERWTSLADGDEHWRSISKDNTLTVYGRTRESRIVDPQNPDRVFSWLVYESYDDKGNAIVYDYVAQNEHGIDLESASAARRSRKANRYVKRVRYGNRLPLLRDGDGCLRDDAGWVFDLVFDYGDGHYRAEPTEADGREYARGTLEPQSGCEWPVRRDPFSTYRSYFEVQTYRSKTPSCGTRLFSSKASGLLFTFPSPRKSPRGPT
jgi:hypothetical protein